MFRPYTPELVGWFNDFGPSSATVDAEGAVGRIATAFNQFSVSAAGVPDLGAPVSPADLFGAAGPVQTNLDQRCPGTNERPITPVDPGDDSVPFTDGGSLPCDPADLLRQP